MSALSLHHQTTVPAVGLEASKVVRNLLASGAINVAGGDVVGVIDIDNLILMRPAAAVLVVDMVRGVWIGVGSRVLDERVINGLINGAGRAA